jgi:phosphatidylinositol alpha-1,6-mannosyltransferase
MNALLLTEVFPPRTGGSGRWFWEIYHRLPREHVAVAAGACPGDGEFDRTQELRVHRLPLTLPSWGLCSAGGLIRHARLARAVQRLMRQYRSKTLHCGKCLPEGMIALGLRLCTGAPYLVYVHGEEMKLAAHSRELTYLTRCVVNHATALVANSHNTACILREEWRVPASRIHVLHPGVDTAIFRPAQRSATSRAHLGWGERPVVLTVGRLQKRKGQDMLIRALPAIRQSVPDVLYAIVGSGDERAALEELVRAHSLAGHVQFLGEIPDSQMLACYQQCDLFALPNRQVGQDIEGFGMVLLEAQACGKPALAGASGGTAETMQVGKTGLVLPCDDPHELGCAIAELLHDADRRTRMGEAGCRWAVERFDWVSLAQQAAQLFDAVFQPSQSGHGARLHSAACRTP